MYVGKKKGRTQNLSLPTFLSLFLTFSTHTFASSLIPICTTTLLHSSANPFNTTFLPTSLRPSQPLQTFWILIAALARLDADSRRLARKERDASVKSWSKNLAVTPHFEVAEVVRGGGAKRDAE